MRAGVAGGVRLLAIVGRAVLVAVTLVFLASMGGGMLYVAWVLVPLHWAVSRGSGPVGTAGWALLAAASLAQVTAMAAYVVAGASPITVAVPLVAAAATLWLFLSDRLARLPA